MVHCEECIPVLRAFLSLIDFEKSYILPNCRKDRDPCVHTLLLRSAALHLAKDVWGNIKEFLDEYLLTLMLRILSKIILL